MGIDLHSHSSASDGKLSPAELIQRAIEKDVCVLAITDHDSIAGLEPAHEFNSTLKQPINLINGIEISAGWEGFDIHIVGLNFDINAAVLRHYLVRQCELRDERAKEMGRRLAKARIPGVYEEAVQLANGAAITRSHFARVLVNRGYATSFNKVFDHFLAKGKTGHMPNNWPEIQAAVDVIHQAGGVAVLAHPTHYKLSAKWLKKLLTHFKQIGGDAIEVVGCQQSHQERDYLTQRCLQFEFQASMGSDFHAPSPWCELGQNLTMPDQLTPVWRQWQ